MRENKKNNIMLNLLKGFACVGVVFIHMPFPGNFGKIISTLSGFAVPLFFMIAGYYSFGNGPEVIKRRLSKIIKIFIYGYACFFAYGIGYAIINHELTTWLATNFTWKTPIQYVFFCTINFAVPLWYLIAMIETYLLWLLIIKKKKETFALKLIPILFLLQIILWTFCETRGLAWTWNINFVTRALPWYLTGYFFHTDKRKKYESVNTLKLIFVAIVGCLITIIPTTFDLTLNFSCVGYIPLTLSLFIIALKHPDTSLCKCLEYIGSKLSLNIYILHPIIGWLCQDICSKMLKINTDGVVYSWFRPFIVLLLSITFSLLIEQISHKIKENKYEKAGISRS